MTRIILSLLPSAKKVSTIEDTIFRVVKKGKKKKSEKFISNNYSRNRNQFEKGLINAMRNISMDAFEER